MRLCFSHDNGFHTKHANGLCIGTYAIIPTRRIISVSKLFCLENIICGGFIWYQLYSSYGLYGFLLSKIYRRRISPVTLETGIRLVCMYYSTTASLFQSILKNMNCNILREVWHRSICLTDQNCVLQGVNFITAQIWNFISYAQSKFSFPAPTSKWYLPIPRSIPEKWPSPAVMVTLRPSPLTM